MENTRVIGWGPFKLPWEQYRLLKAAEKARQAVEAYERALINTKEALEAREEDSNGQGNA